MPHLSRAPSLSSQQTGSGTSTDAAEGAGAMHSSKIAIFELSYISTPKSALLRQIYSICFLLVAVHALSICADESLYTWPILSTVQHALMWTRLGPLSEVISTSAMNVVSGTTLLIVVAMLVIHLDALRQMSSSKLPNKWIIRALTASYMARSTIIYLPALVIMDYQVATRLSLNATDIIVAGMFAVGSLAFTAQTAFVLFMSHQFAFTTTHPLGRQHSRVEPTAFVLLSVGAAVFSVKDEHLLPAVKGVIVFLACVFIVALIVVFTPYYRTFSLSLVPSIIWILGAAATCAVTPWLALCLLSLTPVVALLPMGMVKLTTLATRKYRAEVMALESPDQVPETRPFLLFPYQVEVALRESRKKIAKAKKDVAVINKRVPMAIFEFAGTVSEDGVLDMTRLSAKDRELIAQARQTIEAETAYGMRLFSITRSRWPHSAYLALTYIIYTAAYRTQSLQSAMYSTASTMKRSFSLDFQYGRFLCKNYTAALHSDASVLTKLEAQRDQRTLMKAQRQLADELANVWRRILANAGQPSTANFKFYMGAVEKISALRAQIDALYTRALNHPTPRIVRSYAQYLSIIDPSPAVAAYCEELYGVADELEVAPGEGENEKNNVRVTRIDTADHGSAGFIHHSRAVAAIVVIATCITAGVLIIMGFTYLHYNVLWQSIGIVQVTSGVQYIASTLALLRIGMGDYLVATTAYLGAPWLASVADMPARFQKHALDNFPTSLYVYGAATYADYKDARTYEVLDLDEAWYDDALDAIVTVATHLSYNIPDLLSSATITVPVFQGLVETGTEDVSLMAYYSNVVHACESLSACVSDGLDAGSATAAADCLDGMIDTILGYEKAMIEPVMNGLNSVAADTFIHTQMFPTLELIAFLCLLFVMLASFFTTTLFLFVRPTVGHNKFSMRAIRLLNFIPGSTLDAMVNEIDSFKRAVRGRADQSATARIESEFGTPQPMVSPPITRRSTTLTFQLASVKSPLNSSRAPGTVSQQSLQDEGDGFPNEAETPQTEVKSLALLDTEETVTSSTDSGKKVYALRDSDGTNAHRFRRSVIQLRMIGRALPVILVWMFLFSVVFLLMFCVVLYRSGLATTVAMTLFYQYRTLNRLRGLSTMAITMAFGTPSAPPPVDAAYIEPVYSGTLAELDSFIAHLTGNSAVDNDVVVEPYDSLHPMFSLPAKSLNRLLGSGDSWIEGDYEDEITDLLYNSACFRFFDDMCEAPFVMYSASGHGVINAVSAALAYADAHLREIQDGSADTTVLLAMSSLVDLDVSSGLYLIWDHLYARLDTQLTSTRTDAAYFLGVFVAMLGVFYYVHLYRSIVRNGRTRRQLGLMFRSVPREGISPKLLEKLLEVFPEDE
ncbi:hypothetical protein J8273_6167 [Carpediemonas membranifera]|uniref:Uncharacterized protein n=1 Tax=Carpediemonas membranifera TaxID=201153 RepID=A0A8J6B769_9EUKA|nr:hypothetical protein J8273_6167 [Carpediemonas membranifera]|eukprot:KAG9391407.1 hypothetical protein J8273_6167 [Carpediemonas membranifera]